MPHALPSTDVVEQTLSAFVRREVFVKASPAGGAPLQFAGVYHDSSQQLVAVCFADNAFAATSAAAFALIPAPVAREAAASGKLDESLVEIFAEVLNVLSRLFTSNDSQRITLRDKYLTAGSVPADIMACASGPNSLDLLVDIDGYGKGRLVLGLIKA